MLSWCLHFMKANCIKILYTNIPGSITDINNTVLLRPANEVWGKVMFSQVFVCSQGDVFLWVWVCAHTPWICTHTHLDTPPPHGQQAGGTYSTGMLSCFYRRDFRRRAGFPEQLQGTYYNQTQVEDLVCIQITAYITVLGIFSILFYSKSFLFCLITIPRCSTLLT